jgi:hypothetical protein
MGPLKYLYLARRLIPLGSENVRVTLSFNNPGDFTHVYFRQYHNFFVIDAQPTGPDFVVQLD